MKSLSPEFKVGIFVIIVLSVLTFMTFRVHSFNFLKKNGYIVNVYFRDVSGLDSNTKVKIAGVNAGSIESVQLIGGRAKLVLRMYPNIVLYRDTIATINASGLLGDKYLALRPGSEEPTLKDGDTIMNVQEVVNMDEVVKKLAVISDSITSLTDNLNDIIGSKESKEALRATIRNLKSVTSRLDVSVAENDKRLRQALDSINALTKSIQAVVADNSSPLKETVANMKDFTDALRKDGPQLVKNIKDTTDTLKEISGKINDGQGTLGKLVTDDKLYMSINDAAEGLNKTLSAVDRFRTFITFQGEYLTRPSDFKGYFYLTLQPRPDKYYILGLVSDPLGRVNTTDYVYTGANGTQVAFTKEETERKIEFTAEFGKRFSNTLLRAGLIQNTFGAGIDQFLFNDRLKLTAEAWDFSGDEAGARNPHVKAGAEYNIYKELFISAGVDNIFNSNRIGAYFGGGVRFQDDDIKYLLGTVSKGIN